MCMSICMYMYMYMYMYVYDVHQQSTVYSILHLPIRLVVLVAFPESTCIHVYLHVHAIINWIGLTGPLIDMKGMKAVVHCICLHLSIYPVRHLY